MISEKDRCNTCEGKKTVQETKILEVPIDKGMKDGQKIPFRGEGDQVVNMTLGKKAFVILGNRHSFEAWKNENGMFLSI